MTDYYSASVFDKEVYATKTSNIVDQALMLAARYAIACSGEVAAML